MFVRIIREGLMPRYIIKIPHDGNDYYMIWSTIVDAPLIYGCCKEELESFVRKEYGDRYWRNDHIQRMKRVEETGTSQPNSTMEDTISFNCAGENGESGTLEQIIKKYIVDKPKEQGQE